MNTLPSPQMSILSAVKAPALIAIVTIIILFTALFGWAASAPLEGGALAPGVISPEGSRRVVQHYEGGIIESLLVKEGDPVEAGDTIIRLKDTQARSSNEVLLTQQRLLIARQSRLTSEQGQKPNIHFPDSLLALETTNDVVRDFLGSQRELFQRRTEFLKNRRAVFQQRVNQLNVEISGLKQQINSQDIRLQLIQDEIHDTRDLYQKGLAPRPRLLALQRQKALIREQLAQNETAIARAQQSIGETKVQLLANQAQWLDEVSTELNAVQGELAEINERLIASSDVLTRTVITAPISGTVVNMRIRTETGVIRSGEPILDIVPNDEALIIQARLSPMDVEVVTIGQRATVHLSALTQNNLPRIEGTVIGLSADALTDPQTGMTYFNLRVRVDMKNLEEISERTGADLTLMAGMPADVLVVTGQRTVLEYLVKPLLDSMNNALREG